MGLTVNILKHTVRENRPDKTSRNSFPSGHTATAFMGAEFLFQEYSDYPLIYIAGYSIASSTGFFRMYNNRHWLCDVVAGAGIGLLSTKIAYFFLPQIKRVLQRWRKNKNSSALSFSVAPTAEGIGLSLTF